MDNQIYFKDKKGELKGPFTERQTQEWYRKGHFNDSFLFCFLSKDETPTDSTQFFTLDALRSHNGDACPFRRIEKIEGIKDQLAEQLEKLNKDLAALRVNVETAKTLEQRLKKCEERIQNLLLQSDDKENAGVAANAPAAAVPIEKEKKNNKKTAKPLSDWMADVVDFVMAYFDMLRSGDFSRAAALAKSDKIALAEQRLVPYPLERTRFTEELMKKMEEKEHFFCAVCRMMMITPRQALIHVIGGEHFARAKHECRTEAVAPLVTSIIRIAGEAPDRWVRAEVAEAVAERKKYGEDIRSSALRPTDTFMRRLMDPICDEMFPDRSCTPQELVEMGYPKFKNGIAARIFTALHEHIGDSQTFCDLCKTRTGSREEYYKHVMRYEHTKKTAIMHAQTIAVNMIRGRNAE